MINYGNEKLKVGKNIQFQSWEMDIPATQTAGEKTSMVISFDVDINLLRGSVFDSSDYKGDTASMIVNEGSVVGTVNTLASIGDEWISVDQTVIDYFERGFYVTINNIALGRCLEIDEDNNRLRVNPISADISVGSFVVLSAKFVPHMYFMGTNSVIVMEGSTESSFLLAGTKITVHYINNNMTAKTFSVKFEYLY